jgi:hypothetical protein
MGFGYFKGLYQLMCLHDTEVTNFNYNNNNNNNNNNIITSNNFKSPFWYMY